MRHRRRGSDLGFGHCASARVSQMGRPSGGSVSNSDSPARRPWTQAGRWNAADVVQQPHLGGFGNCMPSWGRKGRSSSSRSPESTPEHRAGTHQEQPLVIPRMDADQLRLSASPLGMIDSDGTGTDEGRRTFSPGLRGCRRRMRSLGQKAREVGQNEQDDPDGARTRAGGCAE